MKTKKFNYDNLDGFRVEIDSKNQRADIILDRPPLNVVSMPQREQIARVFKDLDEDNRVRVIVLNSEGKKYLKIELKISNEKELINIFKKKL